VSAFVVLSASYPCVRGMSYDATAAVTFNNIKDISNLIDLKELNMTASIFCKPAQRDPVVTIAGAIPVLTIGKIKINDITISISAFKDLGESAAGIKIGSYRFVATADGTMDRSSLEDIGQLGRVYNAPYSSPLGEVFNSPDGMLDKKVGNFNLKPKISFDSESKSVSFMLNVEYETPNFNATLFVASTFGKCDPELGTAIVGTAHAKVEYSAQTHSFLLNVSIAGGKHCPAHLTTMAEKGKGAPRFFDNYQRFIMQGQSLKTGEVVDGKWVKGAKDATPTIDQESETYAKATGDLTAYELMDIALGNEVHPSVPSWPQYYFKGTLEEPIEVYPGVDINAASVTVVSAGPYGAKFTDMPFLFEIYGDVDLDFVLQGDNNVTKAKAANAKKTAADDFPAPASVKTNLLNITASAVVAYVPTQNGSNERTSTLVAIRADYEFRSENNKTGTSIDVYDAFFYMMFPIERSSDYAAQAQGKLDLKWENSAGNSTNLHAEFKASFQFESEPNKKGEMKLGDFECKVSIASEFSTPYLALGELYIGVEYWSTMNVTDDEDEPADAPSDAPSPSPGDDYDAAAPSPADAPAPKVEEEAPAPAPEVEEEAHAPMSGTVAGPPSPPPAGNSGQCDSSLGSQTGCPVDSKCGKDTSGKVSSLTAKYNPIRGTGSAATCCAFSILAVKKGVQKDTDAWCKDDNPTANVPPPAPPPPSPSPPKTPSFNTEYCNNDRTKGNDCAVGMICGKQPPAVSDTDYKKSGHVYYSPKSASGKCCNKAKRTVEKGAQLTTADSTGHTWCKSPSTLGAARLLMGVESWFDVQSAALVHDPSRLGATSIKLGSTSYSFSGAPGGEVMLFTALTVVPATNGEAGSWSATMTGFTQNRTDSSLTPSWSAECASGSPVVVSRAKTGAEMKTVRFAHDDLDVHIAGFAIATACDGKAASIPATGVVTLNRGVIFTGRADGTAAPIPTVSVTFPVSALISCAADAADAGSAEVTGRIISYEIVDYIHLNDVAVTGNIAASAGSGGIVDMGMGFAGKVDLSRSSTGLDFPYGELDVAFKTRVTSALGGFLKAEFEEQMLGFGSFMIETGPKVGPDRYCSRHVIGWNLSQETRV
jgi:hypothetical protein